jgi:hypothetical protein
MKLFPSSPGDTYAVRHAAVYEGNTIGTVRAWLGAAVI